MIAIITKKKKVKTFNSIDKNRQKKRAVPSIQGIEVIQESKNGDLERYATPSTTEEDGKYRRGYKEERRGGGGGGGEELSEGNARNYEGRAC